MEQSGSTELEKLKDKLFIRTGEDNLDTWEAFKHYGLNPTFSDDDNTLMMKRKASLEQAA